MHALIDAIAYLSIGLFFTHELDAIDKHEWRILPPFSFLDDRLGFHLFVILHIPFFALLIWLIPHARFQIAFDALLVVHAGAHWFCRRLPGNEFNNRFSNVLIYLPALTGVLHLMLVGVAE